MIKLSDIINYLIQQNNFNSYLEIGVSTGVCFGAVNCKFKDVVDPVKQTSDVNYNMVFVPHGHTIITRGKREPLYLQYSDDWSFFDRYRSVILNLISEEDFYMMYMKKQNETSSY